MHKILQNKLFRYVLVGGFSYLAELSVLYYLVQTHQLGSTASTAIAFWFGLVISFILQKIIAFSNHEKVGHVVFKQMALYAILVIINYCVTVGAVYMFGSYDNLIVVRTIALIITTTWNYFIYKFIIFR